MSTLNFKEARDKAVAQLATWCPGYESAHKKGDELWMPNPLRHDNTNSDNFSINLSTGMYHDFNPQKGGGGDVLELYCKLTHTDIKEAVEHFLGSDHPIILDNPPAQNGWVKRWLYNSEECQFWVYRYENEDGSKSFFPWYKNGDGWKNKKPEAPPEGYPLLNYYQIKNNPDKTIVITEGEKASDAIPKKYIGTTWAGGSSNHRKVNFSQLKNRNVILWPDNDEAGKKCMQEIGDILKGLVSSLFVIETKPEWDTKADAADFEKEVIEYELENAKQIYKQKKIFELVRYSINEIKPPVWLIKDYIEDNSLISLFGKTGSYKSFLAINMATCIATKTEFHEKEVKKSGPVIYIAGEGYQGIFRRIRAWEIANKVSIKDAPLFISKSAAALGSDEFMIHVEKELEEVSSKYGNIALIIVDTWARNFVGNENSQEDTDRAIRSLDRLRSQYECSAIIVHHTGHAETERERGSSSLPAALDQSYKISKNQSGLIEMECKKMKDADIPEPIFFDFCKVQTGQRDDSGQEIMSGVLKANPVGNMIKDKKTGTNQMTAIKILDHFGGTMPLKDFKEQLRAKNVDRRRISDVITSLSDKHRITIDHDMVYLSNK